jgi:hypothetical protein
MTGDSNDADDTFRVQVTKEVWFMNWDLQARGFECLVEHHDIERVTSSEDHIHISCVVSILEDNYLKFLLHQCKEAYAKPLQPKPLWKLCST